MVIIQKNYKVVLHLLLQDENPGALFKVYKIVKTYCDEVGVSTDFVGVSFGSYDWIVDFNGSDYLVLSEICRRLMERIMKSKILSCGGYLFAKQIGKNRNTVNVKKTEQQPIRAYTFMKSNDPWNLYQPKNLEALNRNYPDENFKLYLNSSQYPLIVISEGDDLSIIWENIKLFIKNNKRLIQESSTRITLGYSDNGSLEDKSLETGFSSCINYKLGNQGFLEEVLLELRKKSSKVLERQGWYDILSIQEETSLHSMHETNMNNKQTLKGKVIHTSTLLGLK